MPKTAIIELNGKLLIKVVGMRSESSEELKKRILASLSVRIE